MGHGSPPEGQCETRWGPMTSMESNLCALLFGGKVRVASCCHRYDATDVFPVRRAVSDTHRREGEVLSHRRIVLSHRRLLRVRRTCAPHSRIAVQVGRLSP